MNISKTKAEHILRNMALCQAAVAEAVHVFGKVDILFCCASEGKLNGSGVIFYCLQNLSSAVIGTVEELAASPRSLTLVRDQFETNFFGPVNIIKAVLPTMRKKMIGHIIILTGISKLFATTCLINWQLTLAFSWSSGHPRPRDVLRFRLGARRIL